MFHKSLTMNNYIASTHLFRACRAYRLSGIAGALIASKPIICLLMHLYADNIFRVCVGSDSIASGEYICAQFVCVC